MVSQPNLGTQEQSWLQDSQSCVTSQVCTCGRDNRTPLRDLPLGPVDAFRYHGHRYRRATDKHTSTYILHPPMQHNTVLSGFPRFFSFLFHLQVLMSCAYGISNGFLLHRNNPLDLGVAKSSVQLSSSILSIYAWSAVCLRRET